MYKINSIIFKLIISIYIFKSIPVYGMNPFNGIDEEVEYFLNFGQTSPKFFHNMKEYLKDSPSDAEALTKLKLNEDRINIFLQGDKDITELNILLQDVDETQKESSKALQFTKYSLLLNPSIVGLPNTQNISNEKDPFDDFIKEIRDAWATLYKSLQKRADKETNFKNVAFLTSVKTIEFFKLLKQRGWHQNIDTYMHFPGLCCKFAQEESQLVRKQKLIVAGLLALTSKNLSSITSSQQKLEIVEEMDAKTIPYAIELLEALKRLFSNNYKKPIDLLKSICLVKDNHPLLAHVNYKLMKIYIPLCSFFNTEEAICLTNSKGQVSVQPLEFWSNFSRIGLEALVGYRQALIAPESVSSSIEKIKKSYYKRILSILDILKKRLPPFLWEKEESRNKGFREECNKFLANYYKEMSLFAKHEEEKLVYGNGFLLIPRPVISKEFPTYELDQMIKPGQFWLFCNPDGLYCKSANKEKIKLISINKADYTKYANDTEGAFYPIATFKKILKLLEPIKDSINDEPQQHKNIKPEFNIKDKQALFDYLSLNDYTTVSLKLREKCMYNAAVYYKAVFTLDDQKKAIPIINDYNSYIKDHLLAFKNDYIFERVRHMHETAKNISEDYPTLETFLAPLYGTKSENVQESDEIRATYLYMAAKNYEVFDNIQALNYAISYILLTHSGRKIESDDSGRSPKKVKTKDEKKRSTDMLMLLDKFMDPIEKNTFLLGIMSLD